MQNKYIQKLSDAPEEIQELIQLVHDKMKRRDGTPYIEGHLIPVLNLFNNYGARFVRSNFGEDTLYASQITCLAHDVLEDCWSQHVDKVDEVLFNCSEDAYDMVYYLSSNRSAGRSEYESQFSENCNISMSIVKMCDMISNATEYTSWKKLCQYKRIRYHIAEGCKSLLMDKNTAKLFHLLDSNLDKFIGIKLGQ